VTLEIARREAVVFETMLLQPLFEPVAAGGPLGELGGSYLAQSVAEHDRAFGAVLARLLERGK
jgi:hypothetical protein